MMKRGKTFKAIVVVCICLSVFTACESQMIDLASTRATTTTGSQTADSLFVDDEQPASFPGGQEALLAFLDQSVRYPEGYESCAQGRVVVRFTIDVDGSIVDPKVIRSLDPPLDKEALRVVSLMPKWKPDNQGTFDLPISFKLDKHHSPTLKFLL